jgi:hypothetical protein
MTNKELEKELKLLKEKIAKLELNQKTDKQLTIADIKVGEQFEYCGRTYTKLNEDGFCIIDDYDEDFMRCIFDPITNNYDESIIRNYINSDRFIERLGVNKDDIKPHYKDDLITLLSKEEYKEYEDLIQDYDGWWTTRSAYSGNNSYFCSISSYCHIYNGNVTSSYVARIGFTLNLETPVDRKDNNNDTKK